MIIFGTRGKLIKLGSLGIKKCSHCNNEVKFYLILSFRYFHIFWIPFFITTRSYQTACSICNYGYEIDKRKIDKFAREKELGPTIPWIYKFGWTIPVGIIAFFIFFIFIISVLSI